MPDLPITAVKLVIVDKTATAGQAKAVFVSKDGIISKGTGTDPSQIDVMLELAYENGYGVFAMPQGSEWQANDAAIAKYVNAGAPSGGAVKVGIIKPGNLLKVVGKSLGDTPFDISVAPTGTVYAALTVANGADTVRHCTLFTGCAHKVIGGGTGAKLSCRGRWWDWNCLATTPSCLANRYGDQGVTVTDACTNLEWEKKTPGNGSPNPTDVNDVANHYVWAARCSLDPLQPCQPNLAAETACKAQTPPAFWSAGCEQCAPADGACEIPEPNCAGRSGSITTVWDWIAQLNAAGFAGHTDWRLPTASGIPAWATGELPEATSIIDPTQGFCVDDGGACIDPVFGPSFGYYWASSTDVTQDSRAWAWSGDMDQYPLDKCGDFPVRAVRTLTP